MMRSLPVARLENIPAWPCGDTLKLTLLSNLNRWSSHSSALKVVFWSIHSPHTRWAACVTSQHWQSLYCRKQIENVGNDFNWLWQRILFRHHIFFRSNTLVGHYLVVFFPLLPTNCVAFCLFTYIYIFFFYNFVAFFSKVAHSFLVSGFIYNGFPL